MKKGVIFLITIIGILISILMFYTPIQAMGKTLESSMSIQKDDIKQGEETSITLKINSEEQINAFQAKLSYDEELWEEIDENNFVLDDGWEGLKYNKDNKEYYEYINKKLDYLLDKVPSDKNKELKEKKEYLSYYL